MLWKVVKAALGFGVPFLLACAIAAATAYQIDSGDWIFWQGTTNKLMVATITVVLSYYTLIVLDLLAGTAFKRDHQRMQESPGVAIYRGMRFFAVLYLYANILG